MVDRDVTRVRVRHLHPHHGQYAHTGAQGESTTVVIRGDDQLIRDTHHMSHHMPRHMPHHMPHIPPLTHVTPVFYSLLCYVCNISSLFQSLLI